jgi:hypothetical protein
VTVTEFDSVASALSSPGTGLNRLESSCHKKHRMNSVPATKSCAKAHYHADPTGLSRVLDNRHRIGFGGQTRMDH